MNKYKNLISSIVQMRKQRPFRGELPHQQATGRVELGF